MIEVDEKKYIELLDQALEKIPEDAKQQGRWEIPRVDLAYEGKSTIIKNWRSVIAELNRNEKHLFKKICKELGAAGTIQESAGRAILKSIIKKTAINNQIKKYAKDYVICQTCNKPDTVIQKDGRNHVLVCQACGTRKIIKM